VPCLSVVLKRSAKLGSLRTHGRPVYAFEDRRARLRSLRRADDVLATIDDPAVITRILTHLGLSLEAGEAVAGRAPL
jgi:hypothetical protein